MVVSKKQMLQASSIGFMLIFMPLALAYYFLGLWHFDMSLPFIYSNTGHDELWQFTITKTLLDTGWVLRNPFLGAPDISLWYFNSGAQTSSIHSVLMGVLSLYIKDAVKLQQVYYLLNFPLIAVTTYVAGRALGLSRVLAVCIGILFSFTTYRLNAITLAFLPNYFVIPLSILPVIWIMSGRLSGARPLADQPKSAFGVFRTKIFLWAVAISILTAVSDGYYAFFALMLMSFAVLYRVTCGDWRRPGRLMAPVVLIGVVIVVASCLLYPIHAYRSAHPDEIDQDTLKTSTDAMVYSASPMLLVSPIENHRFGPMARLGRWMTDISNFNLKFPYTHGASVPLGTLGTLLFALSLLLVISPSSPRSAGRAAESEPPDGQPDAALPRMLAILALFVFLCSVPGGIGGLVALVYSSIRAYDRFPIFLILFVFLIAGLLATRVILSASPRLRLCVYAGSVLVTCLGVLDQVPKGAGSAFVSGESAADGRKLYAAEKTFIGTVEASLPPSAMVYQYPYSQFLSDSKYYGWASFGHVRLYLHSKLLRWSNGASKDSPVDKWHERLAALPLAALATEVRAAGFAAVMVDRTVVKDQEYAAVKSALADVTDGAAVEDEGSRLAFFKLKPLGYQLKFRPDYQAGAALTVTDWRSVGPGAMSMFLDGAALMRISGPVTSGGTPTVLTESDHPEVFRAADAVAPGFGFSKISPVDAFRGDVSCPHDGGQLVASGNDTLSMTVVNRTAFDWRLDSGRFPIEIGLHLYNPDGTLLAWEAGRVPANSVVPSGGSVDIIYPLSMVKIPDRDKAPREVNVMFTLVQDGNAWTDTSSNGFCRITLRL